MTSVHCDDTGLSMLAVGQPAPSAVFERHSQTCDECRSRLAAMTEAVTVARDSLAERAYLQPPASVWRSIAATAGAPDGGQDLVVPLPARSTSAPEEEGRPGIRRSFVLVALVLVLVFVSVLLGVVFG